MTPQSFVNGSLWHENRKKINSLEGREKLKLVDIHKENLAEDKASKIYDSAWADTNGIPT